MTARKSARRPGLTLHTWQHYTNAPMFVLSAFFLFAYSWQILAGTHTRLCNLVINLVWVLYSIDYAISLYLAPNRWSWFKSNLILLITMILPMFQPLRLLRFVPMLHMFNRSAGTASRGRISLYAVAVVAMLIYVGALAEYSVEHKAPGATITSFPLSIWWAFVTVTTVGYGDVYPVTTLGRFIAIILMITGIAVIGIVSAMISSWVIDQVNVRPHPVIPAPAVGEDGGASPSANASTHDAGGCPDEDYTTGDEDIIDAIQNRAGGTAAAHRFGESSAQRDRTAASRGTQAHASLGADRAQIEMAREPQRAYASPRLPRRRQTGIVATRPPAFRTFVRIASAFAIR